MHLLLRRPTHSYLDLSPGLDFETRIFYKTGVVERLREALDHPRYELLDAGDGHEHGPVSARERRLRITRRILETLLEYRHPVSIVTKGAGVLRDLDVLRPLAEQGLAAVMVSVTTLDNGLKTRLEPRTASPGARLRTVRTLHEAGIPVGVMAAPMIPYVNDHELESIVEAAAEAGAQMVGYTMLRLPYEVKDLFKEWLAEHYPLKAEHVMSRVRDTRAGGSTAPSGQAHAGRGALRRVAGSASQVAYASTGSRAGPADPQDGPVPTADGAVQPVLIRPSAGRRRTPRARRRPGSGARKGSDLEIPVARHDASRSAPPQNHMATALAARR